MIRRFPNGETHLRYLENQSSRAIGARSPKDRALSDDLFEIVRLAAVVSKYR